MADLSFLKSNDKPLAILGLGVSGKAVADACIVAGVEYHAWVDDELTRQTLKDKYAFIDFSDDLTSYAALVTAAGIKPSHPILQKAKQQIIPIISDIDLLYKSAPNATYVGITGTNGKSTTTALVGHILQEAGKNVAVGGNIGIAACALPSLDASGIYVLELSSYMLEITAQPIYDIAALVNVTEDHLDWHGTVDHYVDAKKKIFRAKADKTQTAIISTDSFIANQITDELKQAATHKVISVSAKDAPVKEHEFLKGAHNHENIAIAFAICRELGLNEATITKHIKTFEGLEHRQKLVAKVGDVSFINDSKATNADATQHALNAFDDIYWILGGVAKADGIDALDKFYPKIRHAFLIGEASDRFAQTLQGKVPYTKSQTMDNAVAQAFKAAQESGKGTVLLSPACASFDQYKNFEMRGVHFETLVKQVIA